MAVRRDDSTDPNLEDTIRQRLLQQYSGGSNDPTSTPSASTGSPTPSPDFADTSKSAPVTSPGTPEAVAAPPPTFPNLVGGTINTNPSGTVTGVTQPGETTATPWASLYNTNTAAPAASAPATGDFNPSQVNAWWSSAYPGKPFDEAYWRSRWPDLVARGQQLNQPDYAMNRVLGMGAGQQDFATSGPFAGGNGYAVPTSGASGSGAMSTLPGTSPTLGNFVSGGNALTQSVGLDVPQGIWSPDFVAQLRALLMDRLKATSQPIDPNAPEISQPLSAARDEAARANEKEQTQLAESLYAHGGLNTDALSQAMQQSGERTAIGLGTLRGTLIQRQVESKKSELRDMMQMALAAGDAQSAREIQAQIAALNATIQREGLGVQLAMNETNQNRTALGA